MVLTLILIGLLALLILYFYECYSHGKRKRELHGTKYNLKKLTKAVNQVIKK